MNQNDEGKPAPVAATPTQAGEARDPWWWVERSVWTERMLTRLTASSIPGAWERSSENAKSLRRQVPAVMPGIAIPPLG